MQIAPPLLPPPENQQRSNYSPFPVIGRLQPLHLNGTSQIRHRILASACKPAEISASGGVVWQAAEAQDTKVAQASFKCMFFRDPFVHQPGFSTLPAVPPRDAATVGVRLPRAPASAWREASSMTRAAGKIHRRFRALAATSRRMSKLPMQRDQALDDREPKAGALVRRF